MTPIILPWPDKRLSPNARCHWRAKAPVTKAARTQAYWLAHMGMVELPAHGLISVRITFNPPDKRKRDLDGMLGACKAYLDGIADAYAVDDNRFIFTLERGDPVKGGRVTVAIRPS